MEAHTTTEIVNSAPLDGGSLGLSASWAGWEAETIYCGSQYGVGADNPLNPLTLAPLEVSRAILIELRNVSSLLVRFAVYGCCATVRARNFQPHARDLISCDLVCAHLTFAHTVLSAGSQLYACGLQ